MQNEEGQNMDLYIPRKCSTTNRVITSKDHALFRAMLGTWDLMESIPTSLPPSPYVVSFAHTFCESFIVT
ncbi:hypothetical protein MLD38_020721 [Melastoma candidum]|uniref:Uncharacterized protein n=1 Tax=Melastoma candidum TaxID=119954 RepID=A0ACB9QDD0_9MYRT|nr:hypothetical protein MLD38_020721 [Melastoma candidum]